MRNTKRDCDSSKKESFVIAAHQFLGRAKPSSSRLSAPPKSRFVAPLFSWSYELLFPQLFYFDNHLRCPRGVGSALCSRSALCARLCWRSSLTPFAATHTKSPPASPFAATHTKKWGVGQITVNLRQASTIRCANLQRLRALLN